MVDILVLDGAMHGMPIRECADRLREELPDRTVAVGSTPAEHRELIADAEVVVGEQLDPALLESANNLRLFACSWAGVGHVDLDAIEAHDVAVTNATGVHGPNVAEHVLGWFLMVTRRLDEGIRRQDRHEWRHFQSIGELAGSRVSIVGLGAIGETIVERLQGFDVHSVGVRYTPEKGGPTDEVYGFDQITEAVVDADYVALACPLTETTRGLIARDELAAMSADVVIANVARGPVVHTDDLLWALNEGRIGSACLDVTDPEPLPPDHPLWNFGNVHITPHTAGHTPFYWRRVADILIENLDRVSDSGEWTGLRNQVI